MTHVTIVGGGPGGYEAALVASRLGAEVTLIERDGLGGSTVLTDCVPSKTLIATSDLLTEVGTSAELGVQVPKAVRADLAAVNARVLTLAQAQSDDIAERLTASNITMIDGTATIESAGVVTAVDERRRRADRDRRDPAGDRRPPARERRRPARRRAHPDLGAGLRPAGAARAHDRRRFRCHGRGVRQRLQRTRRRGDPRLEPRPGAARRGHRRRQRHRGRLHAPRHDGHGQLAHGVRRAYGRRCPGDADRRTYGRRLALPAGDRLDPQHRGPRARGGRRRAQRLRLHRRRPGLAHQRPRHLRRRRRAPAS